MKLLEFPHSHYCEKARWALDCKGIAFEPVAIMPGSHIPDPATRQFCADYGNHPVCEWVRTLYRDHRWQHAGMSILQSAGDEA